MALYDLNTNPNLKEALDRSSHQCRHYIMYGPVSCDMKYVIDQLEKVMDLEIVIDKMIDELEYRVLNPHLEVLKWVRENPCALEFDSCTPINDLSVLMQSNTINSKRREKSKALHFQKNIARIPKHQKHHQPSHQKHRALQK